MVIRTSFFQSLSQIWERGIGCQIKTQDIVSEIYWLCQSAFKKINLSESLGMLLLETTEYSRIYFKVHMHRIRLKLYKGHKKRWTWVQYLNIM